MNQPTLRPLQHLPLLAVLLLLPLAACATAAPSEPLALGSLSGKVVDPAGSPIAGASIIMQTYGDYGEANKPMATATTTADGRFHLGPIDPVYRHPLDLLIEANGFAVAYVPAGSYSIFPAADSDLGTIRVGRGRVFSGQVLDLDGTPRPNATVECTARRYFIGIGSGAFAPPYKLTTDSQGRFQTPPMPVGFLGITVHVPNRQIPWVARPVGPEGEETLTPIHLEKDVPISGVVLDEHGRAIAGANVYAFSPNPDAPVSDKSSSDAKGHFIVHGFGPNPGLQLQIWDSGHVNINWVVKGDATGLRWRGVRDLPTSNWNGPTRELNVLLKSEAWMDGRAVDADTGEPIHLDKVIRCTFTRNPAGEIVLNGCIDTNFEQQDSGEFRVPYDFPQEYHLTFIAAGYQDAETLTPPVTSLQPITGIDVKMHKIKDGTTPTVAREQITGTVTRNDRPVKTGWISLWRLARLDDLPNAPVMRGRTVNEQPIIYASSPIQAGTYTIDVPYQDQGWYLVAEEPGQPLTQLGPITVDLNEQKKLDIACTEGGSITGDVSGIPQEWSGDLWVVAFTRTSIRAEARIDATGKFRIPELPPGEYGLKVGHDSYHDAELPLAGDLSPKDWTTQPDPWKRATIVKVISGQETCGVQLELPAE